MLEERNGGTEPASLGGSDAIIVRYFQLLPYGKLESWNLDVSYEIFNQVFHPDS